MKKIVIIGGGFTGSKCAVSLEKDFDVTLIDDKDYFEFTPSVLRTIIEPEHVNKIQAKHKDYLDRAKFIQGTVKEVSKNYVVVKNKKIPFDYLIIASGSSYSIPIKEHGMVTASRSKELRKYHKDLEKAKKVLLVGGGLVGIELAGEIRDAYKDKEIVIVNSSEKVIARNHPNAIEYAERFLSKNDVKVIHNERVESKKGRHFVTDKGTKIEADLSFLCTGIKSNYEFMKKNFKNLLNERNQIKVNDFLQVEKNIFAGGDISAVKEEKTAQSAEKQAKVIVTNIRNLENGKDLIKYSHKRKPMVISLGKRKGILDTGKLVITGFIPAVLKNFIEWKTMRHYR